MERMTTTYTADNEYAESPKPGLDVDLDGEWQRFLNEELRAMEAEERPVRPVASITRRTAASENQATPAVSPSVGEKTDPTPQEPPAPAASPDPAAARLMESLALDIDAVYQQITREMGARTEHFTETAELLQSARAALLATQPNLSEAERAVRQAQGNVRRRDDSRRWAASYGALIMAYEFLFFFIFVAMLAFDNTLAGWAGRLTGAVQAAGMFDILPFWPTMLWGGIGGVVGALYSLYWHVAEKQDFDRQFNMWYVVQPVMGAMLGAFVYLIVMSGMLAMHSPLPSSGTWFPSAVACLCGFRQKFIFELLDKLMEVIGLRPFLNKAMKATTAPKE